MRYSESFSKTLRDFPKDETSKNARLLLKGGFIDKLMSGSFTLLPLGFRVEKKIEKIIREGINETGAEEVLMPLLHPREVWDETGRWDKAKDIMYQLKKDDKEYALSFTHEEIVMDLLRKRIQSFKDLPVKMYHFSTKFRDELRAKSGILRGREFLMKDLYSAHVSEEDMYKYYWTVAEKYVEIFKKMGLDVKVVEAAGGVFTDKNTHEFQVLSDAGEDVIYYCDNCEYGVNDEVAKDKSGICPKCKKGQIKEGKAIEVGNIFPLGTYYSEKMGVNFTSSDGSKKPVHFASYGIGPTRLIGAIAEVFADDKGLVWPKSVSPFDVHLVNINIEADDVYEKLKSEGIDVLYDDRDLGAGAKLQDADLIGIPIRLVVSQKLDGKIEYKERSKDEVEVLTLDAVIKKLK